jgi:hypothetical protein
MRTVLLAVTFLAIAASPAAAQDAPPPIGPFVVDVRGTLPRFAQPPQLAESRGLAAAELPGSGFGFDVGAQVYVLTLKPVTFGLGGLLTVGRSHSSAQVDAGGVSLRAVNEQFLSVAPQVSFNFGTGNGWSYLSGGIGGSTWSVVLAGGQSLAPDHERLQTINYGGGARWFASPHVAFTFDVRFYAISPGAGVFGLPGSPRTTMLVLGAGVSVK